LESRQQSMQIVHARNQQVSGTIDLWTVNQGCLAVSRAASLGLSLEGDLEPIFLNNLCVATVYTSELRIAIELMERYIRRDPVRFLSSTMAFNLAILYDLSSDSDVANRRKRILHEIAIRFGLQDLNAQQFRIAN